MELIKKITLIFLALLIVSCAAPPTPIPREYIHYGMSFWFIFQHEEDNMLLYDSWTADIAIIGNPLYNSIVFVHNRDEAQNFAGNVVAAWPDDTLATQRSIVYVNQELLSGEDGLLRLSGSWDGVQWTSLESLEDYFSISYPITIRCIVDQWERILFLLNHFPSSTIGRTGFLRWAFPISSLHHPYRDVIPIVPTRQDFAAEERLSLLSKFNYAAALHFEFSHGSAADVRELIESADDSDILPFTEIIFTLNAVEIHELPNHTIAAWPRNGNFSKNLADLINLVLAQDNKTLNSLTSGVSVEDFNLSYPIMVTDLINDWENILELWDALSDWERLTILNLSSSPTRIPAHRLYN